MAAGACPAAGGYARHRATVQWREGVIAMRRTGVIVALGALLGMSAGGVTAAPALAGGAVAGVRVLAASASPHAVGSIHWGRCAGPSLRQVHAQCALLPAPLDYRARHHGGQEPGRALPGG